MNRKLVWSTLLAAALGLPLAAQEPDDREKPKQEEPKKQPPPKPRREAPPAQEPKPEERQKPDKEREKQKEPRKEQEKERKAEPRSRPVPERGAQARGRKIPVEKFHASFGREHTFRVARRDDRRFQYGGYWFEVVEVWPAAWSFDDDCYIELAGDDYYLVDVVHPEFRVLVIVVEG